MYCIERQRLAAEDAIVTIVRLGELEPTRDKDLIAITSVNALATEALNGKTAPAKS